MIGGVCLLACWFVRSFVNILPLAVAHCRHGGQVHVMSRLAIPRLAEVAPFELILFFIFVTTINYCFAFSFQQF